MKNNVDDLAGWYRPDDQFYLVLYAATGCRRIYETVTLLINMTAAYAHRFLQHLDRLRLADQEHAQLMAAVVAGDGAATERISQEHLRMAPDALTEPLNSRA